MNYQNIPQQISYTPAQVAKMFGVKTSTVHAWLSREEMRGNKVGHSRFITPQQINEFHSRRKNGKSGGSIDYTYAHGPSKHVQ
jgi:excisionase family DNA binding protein